MMKYYLPNKKQERVILPLERVLERTGNWKLAQRVRRQRFYWWQKQHGSVYEWAYFAIKTEMKLCETVQRELYINDEILQGNLSAQGKDFKSSQQWEAELANLQQEYWRLERILHIAQANGDEGPAKDGYLAARRQPGWHMSSDFLRKDCAERGGCCGRDCGCCKKSPEAHRVKGWGHCTVHCGCCSRHRGFELNAEDQGLSQLQFYFSGLELDDHCASKFRAYLWALT
jgi:hypothetical protein